MIRKVLVDSSVWITYFKEGDEVLTTLIEEDMVCTNELILTEILPVLYARKELKVINSLLALEKVSLRIDWEVIRKYQLINLQHGINRVGIPNLILLQQVIDEMLTLYSFDKHFKLMKSYFTFELIDSISK